ncbi:hypothetical protein Tco_1107408 [Tanacetum coccineum]
MIISRSHDSADVMKESEITKGKKRASTDNKMIRCKKKKGETANSDTKDTCADTKAGPSKEREAEEIASGGFGLGEKEGPFVEEDEIGFSDDLEGFGWKLENYIETICKNKTCFEKTLAIGLEVFPNHDMLIDLEEKYVQVMNLQTGGGNGHNNFQTGNSSTSMGKSGEIDKVQERKSDRVELIGFNSPEYAYGHVTQAEILETVDARSFFKTKQLQEKKKVSVNASEIYLRQQTARSTSINDGDLAPSDGCGGQYFGLLWAEHLNFNERLCYASSPLRAFLPTFVVIHEMKAIVKDQRWMDFKDVELVVHRYCV